MTADVDIGIRVPHGIFGRGGEHVAAFVQEVEASTLDRIWTGDHVSFKGGKGYDGLLAAMALTVLTRRVAVQTAVYLLPLRHPLTVARQVASVAEAARGRFVFGIGVGGDDPLEVVNCGVDPATRGRRTDEALGLVRRLLAGDVARIRTGAGVSSRAARRGNGDLLRHAVRPLRTQLAVRNAGRRRGGARAVCHRRGDVDPALADRRHTRSSTRRRGARSKASSRKVMALALSDEEQYRRR